MNHKQDGFHLIEVIIGVVVLGLIGVVAYLFISNTSSHQITVKTSDGGMKDVVIWKYNENANEWFVETGDAPDCPEPFRFDESPIDLTSATSILLPGQYRGYNYKPHGGFGFNENTNGDIDVRMPMDATLVGLTRYYEGDPEELQYVLTFESDCGIAFRFDHLHTLSSRFQAIADTTPAPKKNDTRTNPDDNPEPVAFKAGEIIATKVGFHNLKRYGFDFGVYDYRQRNTISSNHDWVKLHQQYSAQEWYGVCWFDMLPEGDAARAKSLSEVSVNTQKPNLVISDYCSNARHTTLDFNKGQPTDE